jgi:protein O-mannosyl-transferase
MWLKTGFTGFSFCHSTNVQAAGRNPANPQNPVICLKTPTSAALRTPPPTISALHPHPRIPNLPPLNRSPSSTREFWPTLWQSPWFRAALLILATLIAYLPATHAGYIWDDDVYVTENPLLSAPDGLRRIWFSLDSPSQYFPLVYTTFRMEHALWGFAPAGYHWTNILLHIANALLVWRLLSSLRVPGAWLAAAIFALHPVQVESVAWITERKNVLSVLFFLLALLSWASFTDTTRPPKWKWYALTLVCYTLALFAKTTACTLPAALLLILWLKHQPIDKRRLIQVVPFLVIGAGMGLLTMWWERYHQGTHGALFSLGLPERTIVAGHAVWFYLGKLIWPADLTFSYPHWTLHPWNPLSYGWLLALVALCWVIYCAREDVGRSAETAMLFFIVTLAPMLGFIMLYTFRYSFVADHYQYAASIGPIALAVAGGVTLAKHYPKIRSAACVFAAAVLTILGMLTWKQCHIYRAPETLWSDTLEKNPTSLMAHYNLGNQLMRDGKFAASLFVYNRAVEIDPTFFEARVNRADNYAALGKLPEAAADYAVAANMAPRNALVQNGYGNVLMKLGKTDEAASHFQQAANLEPHYAPAEKSLADILASREDFAGALPYYEDVARIFPDFPQAHLELAHTYDALHKAGGAIREYRETVRLAPDSVEPLSRLAWLLSNTTNPSQYGAEAVALAEHACALTNFENTSALIALASAYSADGRVADAVATCLTGMDVAKNAGNEKLATMFQKQMELYEKQSDPSARQ